MTKKLVWRLQERPTAMEIAQLVQMAIITKEEAKDILFKEEE